ncbi:MAG: family N-acetyltransferase [Bacilli bacterium]|nr:family N-acetyltransferase [Bacilli bacterium]
MFEIRWAQLHDANILGFVHTQSYRDTYKGIMPNDFLQKFSLDKRVKCFELSLSQGIEQIAIMLVSGITVGFMMITPPNDFSKSQTEISAIYLLKQYQGQGYGKCLLDWGLARLKELGYKKVILWVLQENKDAIRFYERQNFEFDGTEREIFRGINLRQKRYQK